MNDIEKVYDLAVEADRAMHDKQYRDAYIAIQSILTISGNLLEQKNKRERIYGRLQAESDGRRSTAEEGRSSLRQNSKPKKEKGEVNAQDIKQTTESGRDVKIDLHFTAQAGLEPR